MPEPVRLSKRLAEMLPCSRREAERYIEDGWVTVDGNIVDVPQFRVSTQHVALRAGATLAADEPVTILFHQPRTPAVGNSDDGPASTTNIICADNHAAEDASEIRMLKRHFVRLTPTVPLEASASGLVLFTQDWRVSRKLIENAATVEQEYVVEVAGALAPEHLKQLNHRQHDGEDALPPAKVSMQSENRLRFALKGARPGQIAQMCRAANLKIVSMKRIRIGRLAMAKLPPGQWRYLPARERV